METVMSFEKDICKMNIICQKKMFRWQIIWVMVVLSITFFDAYSMFQSPNVYTGAAFGAMLISSIWTILLGVESWADLEREKDRHQFLTQLMDKQFAEDESKNFVRAKEFYEQFGAGGVKKNDC